MASISVPNNRSPATVHIQQGLIHLDMLTPSEYDGEERGIPDLRRESILGNGSRSDVPGRLSLQAVFGPCMDWYFAGEMYLPRKK